jgi:hypothetical protein
MDETKIVQKSYWKKFLSLLGTAFIILFFYLLCIPILILGVRNEFGYDLKTTNRILEAWYTPVFPLFISEFSCRDAADGTSILLRLTTIPFSGEGIVYIQYNKLEWVPITTWKELYFKGEFKGGQHDLYNIYRDDFLVGSFDARTGVLKGPANGVFCKSSGIVFRAN